MSIIELHKALNKQLDEIQRVTYLLNKKDLDCVERLDNWLQKTKSILKENDIEDQILISQFIGQFKIERSRKDSIMTKKNRDLNAVSQVIEPTKLTVMRILAPMNQKIKECESLVKRMLEIKDFNYNNGIDYKYYIIAVWRTLLNDNTTSTHAEKVLNLIGEDGALQLISKNINAKRLY